MDGFLHAGCLDFKPNSQFPDQTNSVLQTASEICLLYHYLKTKVGFYCERQRHAPAASSRRFLSAIIIHPYHLFVHWALSSKMGCQVFLFYLYPYHLYDPCSLFILLLYHLSDLSLGDVLRCYLVCFYLINELQSNIVVNKLMPRVYYAELALGFKLLRVVSHAQLRLTFFLLSSGINRIRLNDLIIFVWSGFSSRM